MKIKSALVLLTACCILQAEVKHMKITGYLNVEEFERIKKFILANGDRLTYRNIDNDNPHFRTNDSDLFLNPSDRSVKNCDPSMTDFNEVVVHNSNDEFQYYIIRIVRKGETSPGFEENNGYWRNPHKYDIQRMKERFIRIYLNELNQLK